MKELDICTVPLEGTTLIEASAGTGKTWSITGLFLRLILEKRLTVDQILVVTFTNAATEELRIRVRKRLLDARNALALGKAPRKDAVLVHVTRKYAGDPKARTALTDALRDFDTAAIFTIHGFCRRLLQEWTFETGSPFDLTLVTDPVSLVQEVCDDFWRIHFYHAPPEFIAFCQKHLKGPEALHAMLLKIRRPKVEFLPKIEAAPLTGLMEFRRCFRRVKTAWPESKNAVALLLEKSPLNRRIYSLKRCRELVADVDHWMESGAPGFPVMETVGRLTPGALQDATKKGGRPPVHPFFDLCGRLWEAAEILDRRMHRRLVFLKTRFFSFAETRLAEKKRRHRIQFYEDLLKAVQRALHGKGGGRLIRTVAEKYQAALVDEFQDTDPVQYDIFSRLFSHPGQAFFMIGDPKQAVYGFRGADVFSYMEAARRAHKRHTLIRNFRSTPGLVRSVNTLFADAPLPFVFKEIPFQKGSAAENESDTPAPEPASLEIWFVPGKNEKPMGKTEATTAVSRAVAGKILALLETGNFQEKEMAVLVRTHRQARIIKEALFEKGIPAVLFSDKNVFDSHEAAELERVLTGIQNPLHLSRVKAALATDMMGFTARDLDTADTENPVFDAALARFRRYQDLWRTKGFIPMFAELMAQEGVSPRLIRYPDGERRLTNLSHLAQLLQEVSWRHPHAMGRLVKWISERRDRNAPRSEAHQLRLESDENAVTIVTMHRSKGLEYPVVFCPFAWEGIEEKEDLPAFHDPESGFPLVVDLDPKPHPKTLHLTQKERLAESIRLLYVAVTRAKNRCVVAWGRVRSAETSAMAYLLHPFRSTVLDDPNAFPLGVLAETVSKKNDAALLAALQALSRRSDGSITVSMLPEPRAGKRPPEKTKTPALACRRFSGKILPGMKTASYSSLVTDADALDMDHKDHTDPPLPAPEGLHGPDIFAFPSGALAGRCFHALFESLDFSIPPAAQTPLVSSILAAYGFGQEWTEVICDAVHRVLSACLRSDERRLRLAALSPADRIHEMEFDFPVKPVSPEVLADAFEKPGNPKKGFDFSGRMKKLFFFPWEGYLRGFIDLVAFYDGRYYLIDWKSNRLGVGYNAYAETRLARVVEEEYYFLQYHLYVLALYRHLRRKKPGFSYTKEFGGVYYLFIRGIHPDPETGASRTGVYYDLPDLERIEALEKALMPSV